jgi:LmbE family N-acetylglucosaminyl deacetylase
VDGVEAQVIGLSFPVAPGGTTRRILCIGAHCDDIEIGCGGTLLQLQKAGTRLVIDWVVLTGEESRRAETSQAMDSLVAPDCRGELIFGGFPDSRLPTAYDELKNFFSSLRSRPKPDVVLCHYREDAHQDHRLVNEMVWGAFRDHLILEYEIVKWDGDLGQPNTYVPLDPDVVERKLEILMRVYGSQRGKDWFTPDTFRALSRLRGVECRSPGGHAEAFHARKILISQ